MVWTERIGHLSNIALITGSFLDNLDLKINEKLDSTQKKDAGQVLPNQNHELYQDFKNEMIDHWKALLLEKAGKAISQHLMRPVLNIGAKFLVKYVEKQIQKAYQTSKENKCREQVDDLKRKYWEQIKSSENRKSDQQCTIDNEMNDQFIKSLLIRQSQTRNPDEFSDILRADVPMSFTSVQASAEMLRQDLKLPGYLVINVVAVGFNRILQFSSASDGGDKIEITIEVKDNHFKSFGSFNENNETNNNCLYGALSEQLPSLRGTMTADEFREKLANFIRNDETMRNHIKNGNHRIFMDWGLYGGNNRKSSKLIHDEESSSTSAHPEYTYEEYKTRVRDMDKHFLRRFLVLPQAAGMARRASKIYGIPPNEVFLDGPSMYQDQRSRKGHKFHAAHVFRCRTNDIILDGSSSGDVVKRSMANEFINFTGHTQVVECFANNPVGKVIDVIQKPFIDRLLSNEPKDEETIKIFTKDFAGILHPQQFKNCDEKRNLALKSGQKKINEVTLEECQRQINRGFTGEGMERYQAEKMSSRKSIPKQINKKKKKKDN